ncbi:glucoamylase family protein [Sphingomonas sp. AX6]|uniref:glucoamylase family protein n=1 Tax=Sphingomonas sp. AX6 TaxID=2653171 RepID=UPI0012F3B53E|nr:glucoamylase family protein [Sphingomonas sp. AX6]VXC59236.1 Tat pathway signal protein [Sphingomonas sp. AX6]
MVRIRPLILSLLAGAGVAACAPYASAPSDIAAPQGSPADFTMSRDQAAFAEDLQQRTFAYFWDTTDPKTCLAPDRWPSNPFSSIAATGFAITAYGVGAERSYVTREQAAERTLACVEYYWNAKMGPAESGVSGHKGFFYHFLDGNGHRYRNTELSSVDTTLLLGGILFAQSYYDRDTPTEARIRDLAERIYSRVDWTFMQRKAGDPRAANMPQSRGIAMGWKPERGYEPNDWIAYDEGMLVYILALASPTHPVTKEDAWDNGWALGLGKRWGQFMGQEYEAFEPLFGHQYSHVWVDFRGITEPYIASRGIDYFENSRRATLAHRAYGIANPQDWKDYSGDIWGWTASDGPKGVDGLVVNGKPRNFMTYSARGVSPTITRDDGTVVPTAAGGSVPFAPEVTIDALMAMKDKYGDRFYTKYGFKDAINPSFTFQDQRVTTGTVHPDIGWVARDHLGIDQGPILAMMENYRSDLIWKTMRKNPHIVRGLRRAGFSGGWLDQAPRD